jgi:farnesol dehydrogenase
MRVLVTGGTGYLGRAIVSALRAAGHHPVVFARRATAAADPGVEAIDGDVRRAGDLARAGRGCDGIVHAAAMVSIWQRDARAFDAVNVGGLRNVLAVASEHGIQRLVYTSSFLALPPAGAADPIVSNDYQRTKAEAQRIAERAAADGAPIVCVHPGVVYGPGARTEGNLVGRLVADHLAGRLPGLVGGDRIWSFTWLEDVARGHVAALERGRAGAGYALGGENVPQRRVFEIVRDLTGRALPRRIPAAAARAAGFVEEWRARLTGALPLLTRGSVTILGHDWPLDSSPAARDLGYAITPLRDGVTRLVAELTGRAPGPGAT